MRKKFLKNGVIAMMAVCGLAFVSCSEDNDEGMKSYKLTVSYSLPSDVEASNVEELKLILGSTTKNDTLSLDANPKEIELPQGQYKVTVTGKVADEKIEQAVEKVFDLTPAAIIRDLDLRKPIYRKLAAYGHMGREDLGVKWENTDRVEELKAAVAAL